MFIAELFTIVKMWLQPKIPLIDQWKRRSSVYKQWNISFNREKEEYLSFVTTWMNLENIMLSKINQTVKD